MITAKWWSWSGDEIGENGGVVSSNAAGSRKHVVLSFVTHGIATVACVTLALTRAKLLPRGALDGREWTRWIDRFAEEFVRTQVAASQKVPQAFSYQQNCLLIHLILAVSSSTFDLSIQDFLSELQSSLLHASRELKHSVELWKIVLVTLRSCLMSSRRIFIIFLIFFFNSFVLLY